jgi:hypothetical protein
LVLDELLPKDTHEGLRQAEIRWSKEGLRGRGDASRTPEEATPGPRSSRTFVMRQEVGNPRRGGGLARGTRAPFETRP